MKKTVLIPLAISILVFGDFLTISAQNKSIDRSNLVYTNAIHEILVLYTDRSLYAVNESINFKINYLTNKPLIDFDWSTVLYLELIKPDGNSVKQGKFPLSRFGTSGKIKIPENLNTGVYYLKAYTRWMRNFTPDTYEYHEIKIINPRNSLLENYDNTEKKLSYNEVLLPKNERIKISTDKKKYTPREKVTVSLELFTSPFEKYEYCIAAIKKGANSISKFVPVNKSAIDLRYKVARFYPEVNGVSLNGTIINSATSQPEKDVIVSLASLNNQPNFSVIRTNRKGKFVFSFPPSNATHDLFVMAEKNAADLEIETGKDFCTQPISFVSGEFQLTELEMGIAQKLSINAQLSKLYENEKKEDLKNNTESELSFYGTPNRTLHTKDYINLPYLEEFLFELITEIRVTNKKTIQTSLKNSLHSFPFLVLLDNIPISDINAFLKIQTDKIERVELIDEGYVVNGNMYNGVINAISKNRDMAGITLPKNSMFFSFDMFAKTENSEINDTDELHKNARTPDLRNCLYWSPDFIPSSENENSFSFYTSDQKGTYQILIQLFSKINGELSYLEKDVIVE